MYKTGLFFGSFNPIHVGHLIIANYMATQTDLDQVWLVVSPQNPFKTKKSLANDYERLHMAELAIVDNPKLKTSNIEFKMPKPSYTVDTLAHLRERYPKREFVLIMGGDNLASFHRWKNHLNIINYHQLYVYKRPKHKHPEWDLHPHVKYFDAPLMEISSSYIRKCIKEGHSIEYLVTAPVRQYISGSNLYQK